MDRDSSLPRPSPLPILRQRLARTIQKVPLPEKQVLYLIRYLVEGNCLILPDKVSMLLGQNLFGRLCKLSSHFIHTDLFRDCISIASERQKAC